MGLLDKLMNKKPVAEAKEELKQEAVETVKETVEAVKEVKKEGNCCCLNVRLTKRRLFLMQFYMS